MVLGEFDLIKRYFTRATPGAVLGVGDDGALLRPNAGHEIVMSTDMLVSGTHFLPDTDPMDLGWKALAVNVSDMAAMGAQPRWATLALSLPLDIAVPSAGHLRPDGLPIPPTPTFGASKTDWLARFADGFFACATAYGVELVGGDTTRGPLNLCITILGEVPAGKALRRDGAKAGDVVWVSGKPGRAALGLACLQGKVSLDDAARRECIDALQRPQPRIELGLALRELASAAIDVSDGLLSDLHHILERSGVGAQLQPDIPPLPTRTRETYLAGGDDYELLFTVAPAATPRIDALAATLNLPLTRLGVITAESAGALRVTDADGNDITPARRGFDHFG